MLASKGAFLRNFSRFISIPGVRAASSSCGTGQTGNVMNVFDRQAKRMQRERAARSPESGSACYLKDEIGERLADRVLDINRTFKTAIDLGCGLGHVSRHLTSDTVEKVIMCDSSSAVLEAAQTPANVPHDKLVADEEALPFDEASADLVLSSLSLHWVNQLPTAFQQIHRTLKKDGVFLGAVFGAETLYELRGSLQLAEIEREGGFAAHISPFTQVSDIGRLMSRAGFTMLTIDTDEIRVGYPSMFELMSDLQAMGENNACWIRKAHLHRETMLAASAIYRELYGNEDGSIPATFHIIYMIGWKADASQPQPLQPATPQVSLKDIYRLEDIAK